MPTLNWIGKDKVLTHHQDVPYHVLNEEYTHNADSSENLIIHGDNLAALKSLLPKYEGRVKCIYIDPPYNTGNEGWVYNDKVNDPKILKWLNEVVGKEGEDLSRHDKWLCMMYPRLRLLHKLLRPDGAIFISIDDNEQANLKLMMDEIFGKDSFIGCFVWQSKKGGGSDNNGAVIDHEYVVGYAKSSGGNVLSRIALEAEALTKRDDKGEYRIGRELNKWGANSRRQDRPTMYFPIPGPNGEEVYPIRNDGTEGCWRWGKPKMVKVVADGDVEFQMRPDGTYIVYEKVRSTDPRTKPYRSWLTDVGTTADGTKEIKLLFGDKLFNYPKPLTLLERVLTMGANAEDSIILDSFAGSGTTAHAVLNLNNADGGNRRFIIVEMEDYAERTTAERVRRVIAGYADKEGTGGSFTYCTIGQPLFHPNNTLNEAVGTDRIREYIWYTETAIPFKEQQGDNPYYLGRKDDTAYYFFYNADGLTTLDHDFLGTITQPAGTYIVYADNCLLSKAFMQKRNIIFKKIPRDITRF